VAACALLCSGGALVAAGAPATAAAPPLVSVGSSARVPAGATAVGQLPSSTSLDLAVAFKPSDPGALDRFVRQVSDPSSPDYGRYLAKGAFARRFGPSPAVVSAVRSQLEADGLTVGAESADGLLLHVSGSAAQVSSALHVSLDRYRLRGGRTGYAATSAPELPSSLAAGVVGVTGLSDLERAHPLLETPGHGGSAATTTAAATGAAQPSKSTATGSTACAAAKAAAAKYTLHTWTQLAKAYGFTTAYGDGDLGKGTTVGIFELEPYLTSDVGAFESCFTLPTGEHYGSVQNVPVDGGAGAGGGFGEAILDVEDVLGLAPEADLLVYGAPNTNLGLLDEYDEMVTQDEAQVISTSWGECEQVDTTTVEGLEGEIFEEAAAQGQTVFAAAGDTGSEDCHLSTSTPGVTATTRYTPTPARTTLVAVDDPGSQPYVTSVGGSQLTVTTAHGTAPTEVVWNSDTVATPSKRRQIGGAGGVSSRWAKPSWQTTRRAATAVPAPATGTCTQTPGSTATTAECRQVPDVVATADPTKGGDAVYCKGSRLCTTYRAKTTTYWGAVGGTSDAAPLWAAFTALADESCGADVGFLNPRLYQLGDKSGDFHDITSGTNDATGAHPGTYTAGPGYDNASGLGSPDGQNLLAALCPGKVGAPKVAVSDPAAGAASTYTVTFTATGALAGGDTVTLVGPPTTAFPPAAADYSVSSPSANAVERVSVFGTGSTTTANAATVTLSSPVAGTADVTVTVKTVANTTQAGTSTLGVETTADTDATVAAPLSIVAGPVSATESTVTAAEPSVGITPTAADAVTVTLRDQYANPVPTAKVTLSGSASPAASSADVSTPSQTTAATGTATFKVTDADSQVVTFSATGDPTGEALRIGQTATVDFTALSSWSATLSTPDAGAADDLSVAFTTPTALAAGSTFTVAAPPGAVVPATIADYTATASSKALTLASLSTGRGPGSTTDNQATVTVENAVGASAAVKVKITGSTNPGAVGATVVAVSTSLDTVPAEAVVTIVPGAVDPANSTVVAAFPSGPADGSSPGVIEVTLRDGSGNPIPDRSVTLTPSGTAKVVTSTIVTDATGEELFAVEDAAPQTVTLTATLTATEVGTATLSFTGISGLSYVPLSGLTTAAVTDLTAGAKVDVEAFAQLSGQVTTGGKAGGTLTLTAPAGTTLPKSSSDYVLENGFDKIQTSFTVALSEGPGSTTDNEVTFTLGAESKFRHPVEFAVVEVTGATNPLVPGTGYATLSASGTFNAAPSYSGPITFIVGPASKGKSTVVATPGSVTVGARATVTVTVEDAAGNRLAGQVVSLAASSTTATVAGDGSTSTPHRSTTSAAGAATFTVSDTAAQTVTFAARDETESVGLDSTTVAFTTPATTPPPPAAATGYDLVGSDGGVFVFDAPGQTGGFYGSLPGLHVVPNKPVVGMVPTTTDTGYFLVAADGGVFSFGNAPFLGSLPGLGDTPAQPITGIVAADTDRGYFLVGRDGGVFAFGTVPFLGSLPGKGISVDDIIGIASTPSGNGYWLVSSTGTVYAFGAAKALGTAKGTASAVSAIAGTPTGGGYWITTENGTVYPFGVAESFSTLPALHVTPTLPVIGIVHTAGTEGYWLLGSDGGIFAFGDAPFYGSLPGLTVHVTNIVGAVPN
jgi:hypothetical protein